MGGNRLVKYLPKTTCVLLSRYLPKRFAAITHQNLKYNDGMSEPVTILKSFYDSKDSTCNRWPYFTAHSSPDSEPKFSTYLPFSEFTETVGHSNGVFCFSIYYDDSEGNYVVWNPLTNECRFLPPSPIPPPSGTDVVLYRLPCFSFDRNDFDCKVLQLVVHRDKKRSGCITDIIYQYELYSLKKNSWREITHPGTSPMKQSHVCVGGVSYWIGCENSRRVIAAFDFEDEIFYSLPFPETGNECPYMENRIMDYDGSLSMVTYNSYGSEKSYEVWVLIDETTWEKVFDFTIAGDHYMLDFWKKNALLFLKWRKVIWVQELLLLDLATKELKNISVYDYQLARYVPSSAALNNELVPYVPETSVLLSRYLPKFDNETTEPLLLLKRQKDRRRIYYLTALSSQDFTPEFDIVPPFPDLEPKIYGRSPNYPYPTYTVGHSNGVLCLRTSDPVECIYLLWNPLTKEHKFLPPSPHPTALARLSSFSFDRDNLDCKVLQLVVNGEPYKGSLTDVIYQYELYSLKENCWREIKRNSLRGVTRSGTMPMCDSLVSVGGVSYWMGHDNSRKVIAAFDFSAEDFYSLPLPETSNGFPYMENHLMDYDGSLSVVAYNKYGSERSFEVWVLVDESWEKVLDFMVAGVCRPLQFWKKDVLFLEGRNRLNGDLVLELLLFDLTTKEVRNLGEYETGVTELHRYVPSSFPLENNELLTYVPSEQR